ncbi:MAG: ABC transporter permease [Muribaculaceae bacterium]|nr:ABC transporter permease [Muribaculaceae bacterium]
MRLTIFQRENWREISATLARNKTRTFLTAFGIFWGTAMLALLLGGATGFKGMMSRNFAGLSTNLGAISSGSRTMSYKGFNKGTPWYLTVDDCDNILRVSPAIDKGSPVYYGSGVVLYGSTNKTVNYNAIHPDYGRIIEPVIYSGRFLNDADQAQARKVLVVGKNLAAEIFGADDPIGKRISLRGVHFTVVGVAGQLGEASISSRIDDSILLPYSTAQRSFNIGNQVHFFAFTAPAGHSPSENEEAIRRYISRRHAIHPDDKNAMWMMDLSEMFSVIDGLFLGLTLLAFFVGIGSLMAGVIGVGNIMWIVVKERTHEFGVRRAIGAKPADITVQVLLESITLTLIAGTAGVCFAAIVLGIIDHVTADPLLGMAGFEISFGHALAVLLIFFVLGTAAGTLPALKAMRIKPIEALRDK